MIITGTLAFIIVIASIIIILKWLRIKITITVPKDIQETFSSITGGYVSNLSYGPVDFKSQPKSSLLGNTCDNIPEETQPPTEVNKDELKRQLKAEALAAAGAADEGETTAVNNSTDDVSNTDSSLPDPADGATAPPAPPVEPPMQTSEPNQDTQLVISDKKSMVDFAKQCSGQSPMYCPAPLNQEKNSNNDKCVPLAPDSITASGAPVNFMNNQLKADQWRYSCDQKSGIQPFDPDSELGSTISN
jgi:hypothetical protein